MPSRSRKRPDVATPRPDEPAGLAHAVFLERSGDDQAGDAAFMVMRLVDTIEHAAAGGKSNHGFRYQSDATEQFCRERLAAGTETTHLLGIIESVGDALRAHDPGLLAPAMLAYAYYLEEEQAFNAEALDVLTTLDRVAADRLAPADAVVTALRTARVNRRLARFDSAMAAYELGATRAAAAGDRHSVLLSRLGRANVYWMRGNLAEAERWDREVLADARAQGDEDARARAEHGLGVVLNDRGQASDAVPHFWNAFQAYQEQSLKWMVLHDLGMALARLGMVESAEQAFQAVVDRSHTHSNVQNAMIELMHCASFRRDHVGFKRWQSRCEAELPRMAPDILVDYKMKVGIGTARFGQFSRAGTQLRDVLQTARRFRLHEFEFRVERIQSGLQDCESLTDTERDAVLEPRPGDALREVTRALGALSGRGA